PRKGAWAPARPEPLVVAGPADVGVFAPAADEHVVPGTADQDRCHAELIADLDAVVPGHAVELDGGDLRQVERVDRLPAGGDDNEPALLVKLHHDLVVVATGADDQVAGRLQGCRCRVCPSAG